MSHPRYLLARRDREAYAEPCGRMRSLEKKLLNPDRLDEMAAAPDVGTLLRLLRRWGWLTDSESREGSWEAALVASEARSDRALVSMDPVPLITTLVMMRYELLNLGAVLRAKAVALPVEGPLHRRGIHSVAALERMVNRRDFSPYPEPLARELLCLGEVLAGGSPREVTGALVKAHLRALFGASSGSRFLSDYLRHSLDLKNIGYRLRSFRFPELWDGKRDLLEGGHLEEKKLLAARDEKDLAGQLARTVYGPLLERSRGEGGALVMTLLEREADNFLTELLAPARYVSLGPEPLWAYYFARERDSKNIRAVIQGISLGEGPEVRRGRLRNAYV